MRTETSRKTLLHLAVEGLCFLKHSAEQHAACVDLLLQAGVPVAVPDPRGRTALHDYIADVRWRTRALENSPAHLRTLERLCLAGASVTAEDADGATPLAMAAENGLPRVREILFGYT